MILQLGEIITGLFMGLLIAMILTILISALIAFIIGILITKWLAGRRDWSDSWGKAVIVNIVWVIVLIAVSIGLFFLALDPLISYVLAFLINLIIGGFIVSKIYDQSFLSSVGFVIIVLILLFIIMIIVTIIVAFLVIFIMIIAIL